jgi:hypothetical protein
MHWEPSMLKVGMQAENSMCRTLWTLICTETHKTYTSNVYMQMHVPTVTGMPSDGASVGIIWYLFHLTPRDRYIPFYMPRDSRNSVVKM